MIQSSAVVSGRMLAAVTSGGSLRAAAGASQIKVGLYSITYLGVWYRGDALTLEQVIQRAKQYGYQGIEIDGKRPHGNPLDMPKRRCVEIRKRASGEGVPIYAVAGNNDFSSPIPEHREAQLVYMRDLVRMTSDLGVKLLRVFLAWPGVTRVPDGGGRYDIARRAFDAAHQDFSSEQIWKWCRGGLKEAAGFAKERGVTLALQNHGPVINDYPDVLRMVKEVDSPFLKVCLDAPLLLKEVKADAASVRKAALDVGRSLQVLSHFGGEYKQGPKGIEGGQAFYAPFIQAMHEIGYSGYIGYELCHPLPKVDGRTVGIDYVDTSARFACEYMRGVIAQAGKRDS